jgi:hypothetical protein
MGVRDDLHGFRYLGTDRTDCSGGEGLAQLKFWPSAGPESSTTRTLEMSKVTARGKAACKGVLRCTG